MTTTTQLMAAYARQSLEVVGHSVGDDDFYALYVALIELIQGMDAAGQVINAAEQRGVWVELSRMLLVPVPFDAEWRKQTLARLDRASNFFSAASLAQGKTACERLVAKENPLRAKCRAVIAAAHDAAEDFKIYCHRTEREFYESLMPAVAWRDSHFVHSRSEFAVADLHDVLVKVGPLRATGRGRVPDALISAPRSARIEVVHWHVSRHASDFGMSVTGAEQLTIKTKTSGPSPSSHVPSIDFLQDITAPPVPDAGPSACRLLLLAGREAFLVPEHGEVWVLVPEPKIEVQVLKVKDISKGAWIVLPDLEQEGAGTIKAKSGAATQVWKEALEDALKDSPQTLVQRLRVRGITLKNLEEAVWHWRKAPTTVIHSPQSRAHFALLLSVLGIVPMDMPLSQIMKSRPFIDAWREIAISRGVAIKEGVIDSELERGELASALALNKDRVLVHCTTDEQWAFVMPDGCQVTGRCEVYRVHDSEGGYCAPESAHREIVDIDEVEQWRD